MTETQAPTFENIARFDGVCSARGDKTGAYKRLDSNNGGVKGIYVRCEYDQINRCYK